MMSGENEQNSFRKEDRMQYIIHGDDFGKNDSRTAANDSALRRGLIHRTTLLVNMPAT